MIFYEQPLNEKVRTFMRLDTLFIQAMGNIEQNDSLGLINATSNLVDIINTVSRVDLRNDLLKEIEKCSGRLSKLGSFPDIDTQILEQTLNKLDLMIDKLHMQPGHVETSLKDNTFLANIIQRSSLPGGVCQFDYPEYNYWLNQPLDVCKKDISRWMEEFKVLRTGIQQLLTLIRESVSPVPLVASAGFHQ